MNGYNSILIKTHTQNYVIGWIWPMDPSLLAPDLLLTKEQEQPNTGRIAFPTNGAGLSSASQTK